MTKPVSILAIILSLVASAASSDRAVAVQQSETSAKDTTAAILTRSEMPQRIVEGPIEIQLATRQRTVQVAEPLRIDLTVDAPEGTQITMPEIGPTLGSFDVTDPRQANAVPIDGSPERRRWITTWNVESISSGDLEIPALEIRYRLPASGTGILPEQTIRTLPFSVTVSSLLEPDQDPGDFRAIKDVLESPTPSAKNQRKWIALAVMAVAAGLPFGLWWWRRERPPSPLQWACREMDQIESLAESNEISTSEVYARLSQVVRGFLELELGIPATSMSTEEAGSVLESRTFPPSTVAGIDEFLTEADVVRFAGRDQGPGSPSESPVDRVRKIIQDICEASGNNHRGT